jgi:hypothetical protein
MSDDASSDCTLQACALRLMTSAARLPPSLQAALRLGSNSAEQPGRRSSEQPIIIGSHQGQEPARRRDRSGAGQGVEPPLDLPAAGEYDEMQVLSVVGDGLSDAGAHGAPEAGYVPEEAGVIRS